MATSGFQPTSKPLKTSGLSSSNTPTKRSSTLTAGLRKPSQVPGAWLTANSASSSRRCTPATHSFSELSRLGRSLMEVMSILHTLMEKNVKVYTAKERYELGNNINSKVLAFAFSLSAEIERSMISSRTTEALARRKSEGKRLGRPKGSLTRQTKLTGKEDLIREYLKKDISQTVIARLLDVNRLTLRHFIASRKLLN